MITFPLQLGRPSNIFESAGQNKTRDMCPQDSGDSGKIFGSAKEKTTTKMDTRTAAAVALVNNKPMVNGAMSNFNKIWLANRRANRSRRRKHSRQRSADTRATKAQKNHSFDGFPESQKNPDVAIIETISQITLPCNQMNVNMQTKEDGIVLSSSMQTRPHSNSTAQNDLFEVAIVHTGQMENINIEQSLLVQEGIMAMVDNIPNSEFVPRFDKSYLYKGALKIVCADRESELWIWERAVDIQNWEGWNLQIVRVEELTKFVEVMVYFSKPQPEDTKLIFRRLERQNPGLCTARWTVSERTEVDRLHFQSGPDTVCCLRLEVDEAALPVLQSLDMRPYLSMGRAKFELIGNQPAAIEYNREAVELISNHRSESASFLQSLE